jgi:ATP-dependent DNA helicase RecG
MQMGRGEELGSGVLNVSKYLPLYAKGAKAQFVEGNPFITVIPLPAETGMTSSGKGEEKSREKSREKILKMIRQKPTVTAQEMMDSLGLSRAGVEKIVKKLQQERRISRVGPDKGGHWEIRK